MSGDLIQVEVAYALPHEQVVLRVDVPAGATVRDAVTQSGLLGRYPDISLDQNRVGIYARLVSPDEAVNDGDRVEVYRPLQADPKAARRAKAIKDDAATKAARR